MPELPEVETIVRQLDKALRSKVIKSVEVLRDKSFKGKSKLLVERKIKSVERKAKLVVIMFGHLEKVLLIHLKMTGQLVFDEKERFWTSQNDGKGGRVVGGHPTADWINELPSKHTRIIINFKDNSKLFFNDMRVFGWMKIVEEKIWKNEMNKLPPDVVDKTFTLQLFKELLSGSRRAIKLVLMDQKKIGGVGNIYANDGLFLARVNPGKPANCLSKDEIKNLWMAIRRVVNKGIMLGGASYSDYKDTRGLGGKYQEHFLVYGKERGKCKKCGGEIKKFKLGGRGTYWCPSCQR